MRLESTLVVLAGCLLACGSGASATPPTGSSRGVGSGLGGGGTPGTGGTAFGGAGAGGMGPGGAPATGGTAGMGGLGGAGGMTGSGGDGGGPGGQGTPCMHGGAACDSGLYCDAMGCGAGTCEPVLAIAAQTKEHAPVCGCNGITFFNPSLAEVAGMAVSHGGACTSQEGVACNKLNTPCPQGLVCNSEVADQVACVPVTQASGLCWGVPIGCDPNGVVRGRGCINTTCSDVCSLIQGQNPWHSDSTCP